MKKLRLLVTTKCNRNCPGCCNNTYDLENLPVIHDNDDFLKYSEIIITGGEPMLNPYEVVKLVNRLRSITNAKLILYTAILPTAFVINLFDGVTLTLHDEKDSQCFMCEWYHIKDIVEDHKSLRLNVFDEAKFDYTFYGKWVIKHMKWLDECPLPEGEEFKQCILF